MKEFNVYVSQEDLEAIQAELYQMETVQRPRAIEEVTAARGHGDLSENFEYQAARNELQRINGKIAELKRILVYAQTITNISTDTVDVGSRFIATSIRNGAVETNLYELVGYADYKKTAAAIEDNSKPIPVTVSSPFGKAIRNKKTGEAYVYVDVDRNQVTGEIVSIVSEIEVVQTVDKTITKQYTN